MLGSPVSGKYHVRPLVPTAFKEGSPLAPIIQAHTDNVGN